MACGDGVVHLVRVPRPLKSILFYGSAVPGLMAERFPGLNTITGNDFRDATFSSVEFRRGIDLSKQRLPEPADFLVVEDVARKAGAVIPIVAGWPVNDDTTFALKLLENYAAGTMYLPGQAGILGAKNFSQPSFIELMERIYTLMAAVDCAC
jgi:hypothetical protein